mmetsp:Transcript_87606/g.252635  ORF Transcript_87606/g.252635 Transcript_87606/m.252635 type:complete len:338 (-) Transcript_87606:221-1234(-)
MSAGMSRSKQGPRRTLCGGCPRSSRKRASTSFGQTGCKAASPRRLHPRPRGQAWLQTEGGPRRWPVQAATTCVQIGGAAASRRRRPRLFRWPAPRLAGAPKAAGGGRLEGLARRRDHRYVPIGTVSSAFRCPGTTAIAPTAVHGPAIRAESAPLWPCIARRSCSSGARRYAGPPSASCAPPPSSRHLRAAAERGPRTPPAPHVCRRLSWRTTMKTSILPRSGWTMVAIWKARRRRTGRRRRGNGYRSRTEMMPARRRRSRSQGISKRATARATTRGAAVTWGRRPAPLLSFRHRPVKGLQRKRKPGQRRRRLGRTPSRSPRPRCLRAQRRGDSRGAT